jgi:hypothetical protein
VLVRADSLRATIAGDRMAGSDKNKWDVERREKDLVPVRNRGIECGAHPKESGIETQ